jgi:hypothetical protein
MSNHPMSRMNVFNFTGYIMQLLENKNHVVITVEAFGDLHGKIAQLDTSGPWPCMLVDLGEDNKPVLVMLPHIVALMIDQAAQDAEARKMKTQAE